MRLPIVRSKKVSTFGLAKVSLGPAKGIRTVIRDSSAQAFIAIPP